MRYYLVTVRKGDTKVTHCFDSSNEALDWMNKGFTASLDDSENTGTVYSISEEDTNAGKLG